MKKIILTIMPWLFAAIGYKATAQETPKAPEAARESQEIIIQKKGEKDATVNIQFKDGKVFINGKALIEFNDDAITIKNRTFKFKEIEKDFEGFGRNMEDFGKEMELAFADGKFKGNFSMGGTFLGVTTSKNDIGAKVEEVVKGSAAEKSGLKKDDIITKIENKKIAGPEELADIIGNMEPKKEVKIYYNRAGKDKTTKAVLQERKESESRSFSFSTPDRVVKGYALPKAPRAPSIPGIVISPDNFDGNIEIDGNFNIPGRPKLGLKIQDMEEGKGVKVLEVEEGSAAEKAGLKKDDIITEIGGIKIYNTDEAREQLFENTGKPSYSIEAKRNNTDMKFEIKIPKKLKTANL